MVQTIPPLLLDWWKNLSPSDKNHVKRVLENLHLLDIRPNNALIEAFTMFWDEKRAVFCFGDVEMTPLLEEIGGFARLPWDSSGLLVPKNRTPRGFLKMMGFKKNDELLGLRSHTYHLNSFMNVMGIASHIASTMMNLPLLFLGWTHRRVFMFIFCFLGLLIFAMKRGRIHTRLAMVARKLMEGIERQTYTIIPMILAEMYRALDRCKQGFGHFEGCNLYWFGY